MPKYGAIYVEKGARLIIDGAKLTNACNSFWYGIQAFGDGVSPQQQVGYFYPNQGYVVVKNNGIIENAEEAFTNAGGSDSWNTGGIIKAIDGIFLNNRRSSQFLKYENISNGVLHSDESQFYDCRFILNQDTRQEFGNHITMWGVRGIPIGRCYFENSTNSLKNHERAIYTLDASYILDGQIQGIDYNSKIVGFYKGVESNFFSYSKGNLYPITVQNTLFDANEISLELGSLNYPIVKSNLFKIGAKQSPAPSGSGWSYFSIGSLFDRVSNFIYCNNNHIKAYNAPPQVNIHYTAGTEIHSSGVNNQEVTNNRYEGLLIGTDCDQICGDDANKTGIYFTCNKNINNTGYDYIFQDNPIIKKQQSGPSLKATGNTFTQNSTTIHWFQNGGNAPVDYYYNPAISQTPTNIQASNIHLLTAIENGDCGISDCKLNLAYKTLSNENFISEVENLKSEFNVNESYFNNYKNLSSQLIDGGSTEDLKENIDESTLAEANDIRVTMLNNSPYVSERALRALAEQNILPQAYLLEILMLNPDATKSNDFLNYLQFEKPNPMPEFMIDLIRASWNGETIRSGLEKNISSTLSKMCDIRNELVLVYGTNDLLYNEAKLIEWLQKAPTLNNHYEVVEYFLSQKMYNEALIQLDAILTTYKPNDQELLEYYLFRDLFYFKKSLLENNSNLNKLNQTQIQELQTIAESPVECLARTMARSALCFFYKICYPLEERVLPNSSSNKMPKIRGIDSFQSVVSVYPNPANDYVSFIYNTQSTNKMDKLSVIDLSGRQVYNAQLNGSFGQHVWNLQNVQNGNYIYIITSLSGEKYTGKINVTHP